MEKNFINPKALSEPSGFTQVVKVTNFDSLILISGQVALDNKRNVVGKGDIEKQLRQVFTNLKTALASAGASFKDVIKLNTYMLNIDEGIDAYRKIRTEFCGDEKNPVSTLVEVKRLASKEFLVEIEAIAAIQ